MCQPENCCCTILSTSGSICLEFTAFEDPYLLVLVVFYVSTKAHLFGAQELCVKVEVAVLGSPSLIVLTVSVDVKQH